MSLPYTPMRGPRAGGRVHAVLMSGESVLYTICRRRFRGWHVALEAVNCWRCLSRIGEPSVKREGSAGMRGVQA